ncbi:uncharacterized protein LOC132066885 isoform X2 [Lycium ferocissimum]|uniref:uncharacterized protein LOC132066885 isoform X2 n=1 Tax=Lycium ferocissimum TaxID=112874 RepID=UPI0028163090|nr:uncharacterized protein LOC132066885 isoform X2 [Lycium ferocissimum]
MANLKLAATMSNSITAKLMVPSSVCISRGFVSATRPSEIAKVDKETAQKIKEAAVAVKEGAQEVKSVISEMSKKVLDKATENEDDEEKGTWETIKEKVAGK